MIRLASTRDAQAIRDIYAPIVRDSAISFEVEPPDADETAARIEKTLASGLPWLVYERDGRVLGYVYATRHRGDRPAYQWSVEVSVYIDADARRMGLGRALYTSLFSVLAFQHIQNAYAGATLPNEGSVHLHESMAFKRVGIYEEVGYKFGVWHDTIWWVKRLGAHAIPAPDIVWLADAIEMDGFNDALREGERFIRDTTRPQGH